MSIAENIRSAFPGKVHAILVDKDYEFHGEKATKVIVTLTSGKTVAGTFTTEQKSSFGGVQFSQTKDIPALMISKINSVIKGTQHD